MGDVSDWVIVGMTGLAMAGGLSAWFLTQLKELRTEMRADAARMEEDFKEDLREETRQREADQQRLEKQIDGFSQVATAVVKMGAAVEHLTEKFGDHQRSQDRALDELKHSIRSVEQQIAAQRRASRAATRQTKGAS